MKKTIIVAGSIFCLLLAVLANSVVATNNPITIEDDDHDVMDAMSMSGTAIARGIHADNIDITKITYYREDKTVTLTMQVKRQIENIGNIDDLEKIFDQRVEIAAYTLILTTTNNTYLLTYTNNVCNMPSGTNGEYENIDLPTTGNTLTVSFDLEYDEERAISIDALNTYSKMPSFAGAEDMSMSELMALMARCTQLMDESTGDIIDTFSSNASTKNNNSSSAEDQDNAIHISQIGLFYLAIIIISCIGVGTVGIIIFRNRSK